MRGDQPVSSAALPIVSCIDKTLSQACQGLSRAAVAVFEPHDIVELGGRRLEDDRVFQCLPAVDDTRADAESRARGHDLGLGNANARLGDLDLDLSLLQ